MVDEQVESCEASEGNDVHDDEVEPGDVDADVGRVVPQRRRHHDRHVGTDVGVEAGVPGHLPEAWNVVEEGEDAEHDDVEARTAEGADGPGLQRQADGDVPLHTDAQRQVDAAGLRDHAHRVDDRRNVGENLEEVESEELLLGVGVDRRQAEHQDAGQDQDGVVAGLKMIGIRKLDEHDKR